MPESIANYFVILILYYLSCEISHLREFRSMKMWNENAINVIRLGIIITRVQPVGLTNYSWVVKRNSATTMTEVVTMITDGVTRGVFH